MMKQCNVPLSVCAVCLVSCSACAGAAGSQRGQGGDLCGSHGLKEDGPASVLALVLALLLASALAAVGTALGQLEATSAPHCPNPTNPTTQAVGHGLRVAVGTLAWHWSTGGLGLGSAPPLLQAVLSFLRGEPAAAPTGLRVWALTPPARGLMEGWEVLVRTPRSKQEPLVSCRARSPAPEGTMCCSPARGHRGPEAGLR